jgi:adenosylmethionine-8-amino-7-oxononanoate aminotransferase
MATITLNEKALAGTEHAEPVEVSRTEGSYLINPHGRKYLDFTSSSCVGNLGWNFELVRNAVREYEGPDYVSPHCKYRPWEELAGLITSIAPRNLTRVFRATGGSEAVDTALQIAMAYTGRKKFLSVEGAYHGNSIGPLSVGASSTREKISGLMSGCRKIEAPLVKSSLRKLRARLKTKDYAAFIMEPVLCNVGVHIPSEEFMTGARELCSKYGTLFIADEVACGFGRTGKIFAIENYAVQPDIMTIAKGVTAGYAGLGATLTTEKIYIKVKDKVSIYSTYGWHPVSTAAAIATVRYYKRNGKPLMEGVSERSQHFRTRLSQMKFSHGGKLSIIGLAIAVELEKAKYAVKVKDDCIEAGLLISNQEEKLLMFPPLNAAQDEIDDGLDILESCI